MVGTTSVSNSGKVTIDAGANATGLYAVTDATAGYAASVFERSASDGDITVFKKGGTTVGTIGTTGGDMYLATGARGIHISDGANSIVPCNATGGDSDATTSLGIAGARYTDLYLSNTAYVNGLSIQGGSTITAVHNENNLGSNSATALATQASIKAYVDNVAGGSGSSVWTVNSDNSAYYNTAGVIIGATSISGHAKTALYTQNTGYNNQFLIDSYVTQDVSGTDTPRRKFLVSTDNSANSIINMFDSSNAQTVKIGSGTASSYLALNGNLGVGKSNPSTKLDVNGTGTSTSFTGDGSNLTNLPAGGIASLVADTSPQLGGDLDINGNEITGTGKFLDVTNTNSNVLANNNAYAPILTMKGHSNSSSTPWNNIIFATADGTTKGKITTNAYPTQYVTSSDYRLKEDIQEVPNATARTLALKPCNFQWIGSSARTDGFLAHELADQVPDAVTGEKDAVDADGNPDYQGIDQAKIVPLLVKTIQELEARITELENS